MSLGSALVGASPALSAGHLVTFSVWLVMTVAVCVVGRRRRGWTEALRVVLGVLGVMASLSVIVWYLLPSNFDWSRSMPLELCDIVGMAAPVAVLGRVRVCRAVLHIWGFGLCTQAFVTPVHWPGTAGFVLMWVLHGSIVTLAAYDAAALGFRAEGRDLRNAILLGVVYTAAVFTLDALTGFNYGYVGPTKAGVPTVVDALGAWPLRVVWIALIAAGAMVAVYAAGAAVRRVGLARRAGE